MSAKPRKNRFTLVIIGILIFAIVSILLLPSFLLINNMEKHSLMIGKIIKNERSYVLLTSVINTSQRLANDQLNVLNKFNDYRLELDGYTININVSKQPKWPIRLANKVSAPVINRLVQKNDYQVKISYQLNNGEWLNYSEIPIFTPYNLTVILFMVEALLIGILLFYGWSIYRLKVPLEKLKSSAESLGLDFNVAPTKETGSALVRGTVRAMNLMQTRIQELIQTRTRLLATISHDLRIPLTRLQLRMQFLNDEEQTQNMLADLEEMQTMLSGVLSFARNDVLREAKTKFDLVSLLLTICNNFIDLGHQVHVAANAKTCDVYGRRMALKRCFSNIIHNATKFGQQLNVNITQINQYVTVAVEDDGPGIPEEELEAVYQPFYSAKSSLHEQNAGVGLGLTVAHEVVKDHQGEIKLENLKPHGLRVLIKLLVIKL